MLKNHYETLELKFGSSSTDIKKSYRRLAMKYHPDKNTGFEKEFKEITQAYEVLIDDDKRREYDRNVNNPQPKFYNGAFNQKPRWEEDAFRHATKAHEDYWNETLRKGRESKTSWERKEPPRWHEPSKGRTANHKMKISIYEAVHGWKRENWSAPESLHLNEKLSFTSHPEEPHRHVVVLYEKGFLGENGGPRGDLHIHPVIEQGNHLRVKGEDIVCNMKVGFFESFIGSKRQIDVEGFRYTVYIPPFWGALKIVKLKGEGLRGRDSKFRGDFIIRVSKNGFSEKDEAEKKILDFIQEVMSSSKNGDHTTTTKTGCEQKEEVKKSIQKSQKNMKKNHIRKKESGYMI